MWRLMVVAAVVGSSSLVHAQICKTTIPRSAPDSRYQVVSGSQGAEVLDTYTRLIWQRCSVGQQWNGSTCTGTAQLLSWMDALKTTQNTAWRVPNIRELQSLIEDACLDSSVNYTWFPNTVSDAYWSSSHNPRNALGAWTVRFNQGLAGGLSFKTTLLPVRLVRSPSTP
mgnify:FL=1